MQTRSLLFLVLFVAICGFACSDGPAGGSKDAKTTGGADAASCPAERPEAVGGSCSTTGLTCDYGEECCCGECYASYSCTCDGGTWRCHFTDACLGAFRRCPDGGATDATSSDTRQPEDTTRGDVSDVSDTAADSETADSDGADSDGADVADTSEMSDSSGDATDTGAGDTTRKPDVPSPPDSGTDARTKPDAASACTGNDPSGCKSNGDCAFGQVCRDDPNRCTPSSCSCLNGNWACTSDCGGTICMMP